MLQITPDYSMLIVLAGLSAVSICIVMWRINIRRFMGYPAVCDLLVCIFLMDIFKGSFQGMVAAIIASLFFSACITVVRKFLGYERFSITQRKWVRTRGIL